jgi:hypothetical protein
MIVMWAFAQTVYVSFGTDIEEFKTVKNAMVNTLRALIEGYDLDELLSSDEILGLVIFILFLFIAFFVMINMFLAIIMKTYDDVNSGQESSEEDPMAHEFREGLKASLWPLFSRPMDPMSPKELEGLDGMGGGARSLAGMWRERKRERERERDKSVRVRESEVYGAI